MLKHIVVILSILLTSCASYKPEPLPAGLSTKSLKTRYNRLIADASNFKHERLKSVKLNFNAPLTAKELSIITVLINPDLIALRAKEGVASAQVFSAGLIPDPTFSFSFDKYLHQTIPATIPLVNGLSASIGYNLMSLIMRKTNINVVKAQYDQIHFDVAWQEWLYANNAELLATRLYFLKSQINIVKQSLASSKKLVTLAKRNLKIHDLTIDAYALRQSSYMYVLYTMQSLKRQYNQALLQLHQTLGIQPTDNIRLSKPNLYKASNYNLDKLYELAFESRLDLTALRAGYQSQESSIHQAILQQFPTFFLDVSRGHDTGNVNTLGSIINFTIPIFNRNQGAIKSALAMREQLYKEYTARLFKTRSDIATLVTDLKILEQTETLLKQTIPDLRESVRLMYQGLKKGNITEVAYQGARMGLFDKELNLISIEQQKAEQRIALQIAIGRQWNEVNKKS